VDANGFPKILLYATFIVMSKEVQLIMMTVRLADIPMETFLSRKKEKEKKRSNKSSLISLKCFPSEREIESNYTAGGKNP
jgi:hypothetical protein